jgi:RNA polymerase sigma-70 factor (ECF subfamily)
MSVSDRVVPGKLELLLARTGQGDHQAFAELYRRAAPRLFGLCLRMLREHAEAEDVLQEVFATVWRRATSFDATRSTATTWLTALCRYRAIDRLRHRRVAVEHDPHEFEEVAEAFSPATELERDEEYRRLQRCLEQLQPEQRRSVHEAFFTGTTYRELAARRQVPLGTMKSWIRRGLQQLRSCMEA